MQIMHNASWNERERRVEEKNTGKDSYRTNCAATYECPTDARCNETRTWCGDAYMWTSHKYYAGIYMAMGN